MIMSYIEIDSINFSYEDGGPDVLRDFSVSAERGESIAFTGDNGSGKTTLLRILAGLSFPQSGRYVFDGTLIDRGYLKDNRNSKRFHKRVGFLFQNPDIMLFNPKVYDEIAFGPRQLGLGEAEVDMRVRSVMEMFSLTELSERVPYHLSGGQKKKVALASVIVLDPEVLILDEPMSGLDSGNREWLAGFLCELKAAGRTLLMATHDAELMSLAERVAEL